MRHIFHEEKKMPDRLLFLSLLRDVIVANVIRKKI